MKVLQLSAVDFTVTRFLLPLITRLQDAGHEVVVACADGPLLAPVRAAGVAVAPVPFSRHIGALASHWRAFRMLVALMRRERFDIVHVHTPLAAFIGRLAAWRAGAPCIVYTAHGFYFHDRMGRCRWAVFVALEWLAGRVTDVLFTQSLEDAAVARRYHLCRGATIEAIGNGVDPNTFYPETDEKTRCATRGAVGSRPGRCVIAVIGRLVAEKGYPELFRAIKHVDADLWVIGARLESDHAAGIDHALVQLESDPDLNARVHVLGARDDVPNLLRAADLFVLPSHREGMPRSIIEAMMTGLAVVATDIRGSREEVVDGETGFLVPVDDAIALAEALNRLVADSDLRAAMGAAGYARARALYDEATVIDRQMEILRL